MKDVRLLLREEEWDISL